jgi:glycosyltransferase involved in cell wall biosynthesis
VWTTPGDPVHLAERIGWLLDRPEVMAGMSASNRAHARRFDAARVAADYLAIYRRVAGSGLTLPREP